MFAVPNDAMAGVNEVAPAHWYKRATIEGIVLVESPYLNC